MYFEKGLLFQLEVEKQKKNSFTFSVSKWRSGLGAEGLDKCKAKRRWGKWTYEEGTAWIS